MSHPSFNTAWWAASLILSCIGLGTAQADVYKYTDKDGTVKYTDKPELLPAELLARVKSVRTDNSAIADQVAADLKARDEAAKQQASSSQEANDKKKAEALKEADKANRCIQARGRYQGLMSTGRQFSVDDKGERIYMDDSQLDQARATAKEQMDSLCN